MGDLNLPPRNYGVSGAQYGAQMIAAKYCGLSTPPWCAEGEWQHGWIAKERNIHPEAVVGYDGLSFFRREKVKFFVAREDQEIYLRSCGYKYVFAIGLPIIYLADNKLDRLAGSLLVMPIHSLQGTGEQWDDDEYVEYITSISAHFSKIVICIHSSCMLKGNWHAFIKAGFEVVDGADVKDANSLQRMANLFAQFEYVTSNEFGSQVAYASYFGCKVSVFGSRVKFNKANYADLSFFKNAPELLDVFESWDAKDTFYKAYSQFVINPWQADTYQEWAAWELGLQNKRTSTELMRLFGWDTRGWLKIKLGNLSLISARLYRSPYRLAGRLYRKLSRLAAKIFHS